MQSVSKAPILQDEATIRHDTQPVLPDSPWYVCLTKPRQERVAQVHLEEQGYEVYLPLLTTWQRRAAQWQRADSIMFPRYAFVRPGHADQSIAPARSTPGVTSLVSFGHILGCITAERLDALRVLVDSRAQAMPDQPFRPGEKVVFSSGPLKGMQGLVSKVASERIMVMMSLLGREKLVAVPVNQLAQA
jgi:transcriptional antiterminator RfaH